MFRNYLKIAFRNIVKNKFSSLINIGGLAIGMCVTMLIGLWIYDEVSFNKYHANYKEIARVNVNAIYDGQVFTISSNPIPLANELRTSFAGDFKYVAASTGLEQHILKVDDKTFLQQGRFMEPDANQIFSLKIISGRLAGLNDPYSVMIAESLSKKLFGKEDAVDKTIKIDDKTDVKVTGVFEDMPENAELKDLSFIAPLELYILSNDWVKNSQNDWSNQSVQIFTQLHPGKEFQNISSKIKDVKLRNVSGDQANRKPELFLDPMSKWHLYSKFENGVNVLSEELKLLWVYGIIAIFVLALACINFMNLSTARSEKRAREVGIRKAMGSIRGQLIRQFFSESIVVAFCAFAFSLLLVQLALPWFNQITGKTLNILWSHQIFWLSSFSFVIITGLLAGAYPALYLSSFNPVKVLKASFRIGSMASTPRQALVVVQFTISIALIIGTIVIYRQTEFGQNRPIGYSRDNLVSIPVSADMQGKLEMINTELKKTGFVSGVAASSGPLTSIWSTSNDFSWSKKSPAMKIEFGSIGISHEYGKTVGWQFVQGRDFSRDLASDSLGFVMNEAAIKIMGLKDGVGEIVKHNGKDYRIIGVVKNMVMESPFDPPYPTVFSISGEMNAVLIKLTAGKNTKDAMQTIESSLRGLFPGTPLNLKFVDDEYASKFIAEKRISGLVFFFAVLSIFISSLGLFGLISFVAEQRNKEIGIRKVLGASVLDVWGLLSKNFVVLMIISLFVATPLSYYFMSGWLENYTYRISLSWWIFAAAGLGALLITLFTISFQSIKTALINPVKSLRSE